MRCGAGATERSGAGGPGRGGAGFLLKDTPPDDLIRALQVAAAGEPILSPWVTRQVIERHVSRDLSQADEARRRVAALTDRERDVQFLLREDSSNAEITKELLISEGRQVSRQSHPLRPRLHQPGPGGRPGARCRSPCAGQPFLIRLVEPTRASAGRLPS